MILTLTNRCSLHIAIIIFYLVVKIQYKEFKVERQMFIKVLQFD